MQLFDAMPNSFQEKRFNCFVTDSADLIREARFLRYRVLAGEHGAKHKAADELPDYDEFDAYCDHLIVFDYFQLKVAACTRLLNQQQAQKIGYFHAQTEFDLGAIFDLPGRLLEVGRICIDPAYCNSTVMSELCSGLARHALEGRYQYLFGCDRQGTGSIIPIFNAIPNDTNRDAGWQDCATNRGCALAATAPD